jgi:hypothetical protein
VLAKGLSAIHFEPQLVRVKRSGDARGQSTLFELPISHLLSIVTRSLHLGATDPRRILGGPPGCNIELMDIDTKVQSLLSHARQALAALNTNDRSVGGLVDRVSELRYAEGTLVGFLDALVVTDPQAARLLAPKIEGFVSEAIAARLLLD